MQDLEIEYVLLRVDNLRRSLLLVETQLESLRLQRRLDEMSYRRLSISHRLNQVQYNSLVSAIADRCVDVENNQNRANDDNQ